MKRRSRSGGEPIKGRPRKAPEPTRHICAEVASTFQFVCIWRRRGCSALQRTRRSIRATDSDVGGAEGHKRVTWSPGASVSGDAEGGRSPCEKLSLEHFYRGMVRTTALWQLVTQPQKLCELNAQHVSSYTVRPCATYAADGEEKVVHDVVEEIENGSSGVELGGIRTLLGVPLLKEGKIIGPLLLSSGSSALHRQADRACHELRRPSRHRHRERAVAQRTAPAHHDLTDARDLTEALEQQTATSEVLQVISSSPGDLAARVCDHAGESGSLCDATFGNIYRWDGELCTSLRPIIRRPPSPSCEAFERA